MPGTGLEGTLPPKGLTPVVPGIPWPGEERVCGSACVCAKAEAAKSRSAMMKANQNGRRAAENPKTDLLDAASPSDRKPGKDILIPAEDVRQEITLLAGARFSWVSSSA